MVQPAKPATEGASGIARKMLRFWTWWSMQLATLVPGAIRDWWKETDRRVFLTFTDDERIVFERELNGRQVELLALTAGELDSQVPPRGLKDNLAGLMKGRYRLFLRLKAEKVLFRNVSIPMAAEENLRQTLGFELDRLTPFASNQAYFDYHISKRDTEKRVLGVELAAAKRTTVDQEVMRAVSLGLHVDGVVPNTGEYASRVLFNLLPGATSNDFAGRGLWPRLLFFALALVLLAALLGIPVWQKRVTAINLLSPLAEAKQAATETEKSRERLDKLVSDHNFLPDKKWKGYSALMVLSEISKVLPDDSFVTILDFDGATVQVQGESTSAAGLVEALDASPMFKDVGFKAQVSKIQGAGTERFHISATLDVGARPKQSVTSQIATDASPPAEVKR